MCMYGDWVVRNNVIQVIIINVRQRYTSMPKEKTEKAMELAVVRRIIPESISWRLCDESHRDHDADSCTQTAKSLF